MKTWKEVFSQYLLDLSKLVFTSLIIGRFVMPQLINLVLFITGIISLLILNFFSYNLLKTKKIKGDKTCTK